MLIKEYVKYWFYTYRMPHQARNTQETTWNLIRNHIVDSSLGERELTEVTVKELQEFLTGELLHGSKMRMWHSDKIGTPLSHHSAVKLRQILIAMYKQAVKEGYLNRNLAEDTEPIPLPWHDAPIFTPENQRKFLQATRHHRYHTAYVMLFFLGLRRSELLGLSWDAVDMKRNLLHIRQVLVVENHQIVIRERTKTRASIRTVPFPLEIKCMLQDWRKKQKVESMTPGYDNKYHLVFCNKDGSPINPDYFSRNFKGTVKRLDFLSNDLHLHSVRHTWATNMIQCGIAITDVQTLGGWSRPDTLLNVYAHTVKDSQRKAMRKLFRELQ